MARLTSKWQLAYAAYGKKVHTFARNSYYVVPGYNIEDMEQELLEVLWWCVFDYNPSNGATFNTFFQTSARNRIGSLRRASRTAKRTAEVVSLDEEELHAAIEEAFTDESAEDIVVRRIVVAEFVDELGEHGVRQFIRRHGADAMMRDDESA